MPSLFITTECNRRCPFCFVGALKDGTPQQMSVSGVDRVCRFFELEHTPPQYGVSLLGGEPTLHPDLLEIIDCVRSHKAHAPINLLTNLTCDGALLSQLVERHVSFTVNLVGPGINTVEQERVIAQNLDTLARTPEIFYNAAVTIASPREKFDYLYDFLRSPKARRLWSLRVGIACPGLDFANEFARDLSAGYGRKYLEIVTASHRINPQVRFINECAVNLCLMPEDVYEKLAGIVVDLRLDCREPNMDIMPDFSTQWCFAWRNDPRLRIENIFDYPNADALQGEMIRRRQALLPVLEPGCRHRKCRSIGCKGPCHALSLFSAGQGV